jgi:hypothetical protein
MIKNILAIPLGLIIGSIVNMGLVTVGPMIIPPPEGADVSTMESLAATMHLFEPQHFIAPFLAHALGTLVGALIAYLIASSHKQKFAYLIGGLFFLGGAYASYLLPAPTWFMVLDMLVSYIPMAIVAVAIGHRIQSDKAAD